MFNILTQKIFNEKIYCIYRVIYIVIVFQNILEIRYKNENEKWEFSFKKMDTHWSDNII